jgi:hypothetical protein
MCIISLKKYMSEEKQSRLDFSKCQDLISKECCVTKGTVPHVCREAKKGNGQGTEKVLLSPRKCINIPKRATNIDDLQKMYYTELF